MSFARQRLYRSQSNKVIAGVCGGIGEYANIDPTIVRLVWIFLTFFGGSGILIYIFAYFIIPEKPAESGSVDSTARTDITPSRILGITFVGVGAIILLDNLDIISFHHWWHMSWEFILPAIFILTGIYFLIRQKKITQQQTIDEQKEETSSTQSQENTSKCGNGESVRPKVFRRSATDKKIFGICGGAGEYLNIDPTIIRVAFAFFTLLSGGAGFILYFILYLIVPEDQPQKTK
jgi:phage shock protein C